MVIRKEWTLKLCHLIEKRGLQFTWQLPSGTRSEAIDEDVAKALYRTGCRNEYAPESGLPRILKNIKKQVDSVSLQKSVRSALRQGIHVRFNLIFGFLEERRWDMLESAKLTRTLSAAGAHYIDLGLLSLPGDGSFRQLQSEGVIPELDDRYSVTFSPFEIRCDR